MMKKCFFNECHTTPPVLVPRDKEWTGRISTLTGRYTSTLTESLTGCPGKGPSLFPKKSSEN